jgi:hypothetical protein
MQHHGPFSPDDPDWNCQAQLEEQVLKHFERLLGPDNVPAESTIRLKVSGWLRSPHFKGLVVSSAPKADN